MSAEFETVTTAQIAVMASCTRRHATNRIIKMPGFPRPVVNLTQKTRAWDRDEIVKFLSKRQRKRQSGSI